MEKRKDPKHVDNIQVIQKMRLTQQKRNNLTDPKMGDTNWSTCFLGDVRDGFFIRPRVRSVVASALSKQPNCSKSEKSLKLKILQGSKLWSFFLSLVYDRSSSCCVPWPWMGVRSLCQEVSKKKAALSGLKGTCSDETVAFTMNFNDIQESPGDIHVNT